MDIEKHIENLKEYCKVDEKIITDDFNKDFIEFCRNHVKDIKALISEYEILKEEFDQVVSRVNFLEISASDDSCVIEKMAKIIIFMGTNDNLTEKELIDKM